MFHEVRPVISGRRLVITYNLVHTMVGAAPVAGALDKASVKLQKLLESWKTDFDVGLSDLEDSDTPDILAYLLEHKYSQHSLSYSALKGHDHRVVASLREASLAKNFYVCLANLERTIEGPEDEYEECDDTLYEDHAILDPVVDLNIGRIARKIEISHSVAVQKDAFEEPDDEKTEYTGNEGTNSTKWYRHTVSYNPPLNSNK